MTPQQLIGVGVRLFATWLVMSSITYLVAIPDQLSNSPGLADGANAVSYAIAVAYMLGALLLWFFPMVIAHRLIPKTQHNNRLSFQAQELARVGCGLMGLWVFAKTLPTLTWFFFRAFLVAGSTSSFSTLDSQAKLDIFVAAFELAFAVVLIVKAGTFAKIVVPKSPAPPVSNDL
ncbi:MAG: hypothetical protein Q7T07_14665 [Burkholderiaceae bacterium]|nr:hypothetical protein [Burkholderiaceae bacterium]